MNITLNSGLMNEIVRVYNNQSFQVNRNHVMSRYGNLASLANALTVASFIPKKGSVTVDQLVKMAKVSDSTVGRVVDLLMVSGLVKNVSKGKTQQLRLA